MFTWVWGASGGTLADFLLGKRFINAPGRQIEWLGMEVISDESLDPQDTVEGSLFVNLRGKERFHVARLSDSSVGGRRTGRRVLPGRNV